MAPKKLLQKLALRPSEIKKRRSLAIFGSLLHHPNLWHINRNSTAGAVSVGLFMAYIPVPIQMFLAAAAAIIFKVNLPLSMLTVWVTNPITIFPMFYFAYQLGAWILGIPATEFTFELSMAWVTDGLLAIWQPLLLGSLICASICSLLGNIVIRIVWRWWVIKHWKERQEKRRARELAQTKE